MKITKAALQLACVFISCLALAAPGWQQIGPVTAVRALPNGVELKAGEASVQVLALSPTVVRVRYAPRGAFPPDQSFAVVSPAPFSAPAVRVQDNADVVEFATGAIRVRIVKPATQVVFLTPAGEVISQDSPKHPAAWSGSEVRVWKVMPQNEHYFGLGDKAGPLDHRDQAFTMWNTDAFGWQESTDPLYKSIPFFLAMRGGAAYGIFFDNTFRSSFDMGKASRDEYSFGADGGELNYYFFYGPHPKKVLEDYTALTGRTPLPPLFTVGYQQCRYSYYPEAQVREIARQFRQRKIPADVLYLDIDYQNENRPFTIDRQRFPNFEAMIRDLGREGFKVIAITDLHIKKEVGYKPYDEGMAGDHFVKNPDGSVYVGKVWPGDSVFPDFTRAATREWWGNLYKDFVNMGIRGFWNDMNEPAVFRYPEKTMPLDTVHRVEDRKTTHREIHNVVGMQNGRATYEGLRRLQPDVRPFVLTRAAYAGTQRYAATWTGDNSSTWNHLRMSVPTLLSLSISGYPFVGVDIGGFDGSPTPELLTRWIELGAFNPMFRNHTTKGTLAQEPWVHGPEHEAIRRRYIETRYKLLPYIYTNLEETTRTGVPLMRPMFMEFPAEEDLETTDREYMFGADLLVAPKVVEFVDPYEVALPKGIWYDYWSGARLEGGKKIKVQPALDVLPVFVRGGAIIPHQPLVQNVDEVPQGPLELRVYPGPECRGALYADDGKSFAYQRGEWLRIAFTCVAQPDSLQVKILPAKGRFKPWWSTMQVAVVTKQAPREVTVGGKTTSDWKFNPQTATFTVAVPSPQTGAEVVLKY